MNRTRRRFAALPFLACVVLLGACVPDSVSPTLPDSVLVDTGAQPNTTAAGSVTVEVTLDLPGARFRRSALIIVDGVEYPTLGNAPVVAVVPHDRTAIALGFGENNDLVGMALIGDRERLAGRVRLTPERSLEALVYTSPLFSTSDPNDLAGFRAGVLDSAALATAAKATTRSWGRGEFATKLTPDGERSLEALGEALAERLRVALAGASTPPSAALAIAARLTSPPRAVPWVRFDAPQASNNYTGSITVEPSASRQSTDMVVRGLNASGKPLMLLATAGPNILASEDVEAQNLADAADVAGSVARQLLRGRAPGAALWLRGSGTYRDVAFGRVLTIPSVSAATYWGSRSGLAIRVVQPSLIRSTDPEIAKRVDALNGAWTRSLIRQATLNYAKDEIGPKLAQAGLAQCAQGLGEVILDLSKNQPEGMGKLLGLFGTTIAVSLDDCAQSLAPSVGALMARSYTSAARAVSDRLRQVNRVLYAAYLADAGSEPPTVDWGFTQTWLDDVTFTGPGGAPLPTTASINQRISVQTNYYLMGTKLWTSAPFVTMSVASTSSAGQFDGTTAVGTAPGTLVLQAQALAGFPPATVTDYRSPGIRIECPIVAVTRVSHSRAAIGPWITIGIDNTTFEAYGRPAASCDPSRAEQRIPDELLRWGYFGSENSSTVELLPTRENPRAFRALSGAVVHRFRVQLYATAADAEAHLVKLYFSPELRIPAGPGSITELSFPAEAFQGASANVSGVYRDANGHPRPVTICARYYGMTTTSFDPCLVVRVGGLGFSNTYDLYALEVLGSGSQQFSIFGKVVPRD